jgi:hypothetical protein
VVSGQIDLDLPALGLGFLQTQNVWLVCFQKRVKEAFFQDGPNAIDVPRVQLHLSAPNHYRGIADYR